MFYGWLVLKPTLKKELMRGTESQFFFKKKNQWLNKSSCMFREFSSAKIDIVPSFSEYLIIGNRIPYMSFLNKPFGTSRT